MKLNVRMKLLATSCLLLAASLAVTVLAVVSLGDVNTQADRAYAEGTTAVEKLSAIDNAVVDKARLVTYSVIVAADTETQTTLDALIVADDNTIGAELAAYEALPRDANEQADLDAFKSKMVEYQALFDKLHSHARAGYFMLASSELAPVAAVQTEMMSHLDNLMAAARARALALNDATQSTFEQARLMMIVVFLVALALGLTLSIRVSSSIRGGVRAVQETLTSLTDNCATALESGLAALARNDLSVEVRPATEPIEKYGSDEIGQTAAVTNAMLGKGQGHDRELRDGQARSGRHGRRGQDRGRSAWPGPRTSSTRPRLSRAARRSRSPRRSARWPPAPAIRPGPPRRRAPPART